MFDQASPFRRRQCHVCGRRTGSKPSDLAISPSYCRGLGALRRYRMSFQHEREGKHKKERKFGNQL